MARPKNAATKAKPTAVKVPAKKPIAKKTAGTATTRKLKQPTYRSFRLAKRIKSPAPKLPSAWKLFKQSITPLYVHWRLFAGMAALYGLLTITLVQGIGGGLNLSELKNSVQGSVEGKFGSVTTSVQLFTLMLASAGTTTSPSGASYQTMLIIFISVVIIWTLRQVLAGKEVGIKDPFYKGAFPLVPFILVLMVIGVQLLPLLIGNWLVSTVIATKIAVTALEQAPWVLFAIATTVLTVYMVCSSVFALYIVTLPDMTPMRALRSARKLVLHRRSEVVRKVLALPVILFAIAGVIMLPILLYASAVAVPLFFIITIILPFLIHSYIYTLYRALL